MALDILLPTLFLIMSILLMSLYLYMSKFSNYFEIRGIDYVRPIPFLGSISPMLFLRKSITEYYNEYYFKFKDKPYFGLFQFWRPTLIVRDARLIEKILVEDFSYFNDHGLDMDLKRNWLHSSVFNLRGGKWKAIRGKLVQIFTPTNMKRLTPLIREPTTRLLESLKGKSTPSNDNKEVDVNITESVSKYGLEIAAATNFSSDARSVFEAGFWHWLRDQLTSSLTTFYGFFLFLTVPKLAKLLKLELTKKGTAEVFSKMVTDTMERRLREGVKRKDLIQHLLELKEKGKINLRGKELGLVTEEDEDSKPFEITEKLLVAQAFSFVLPTFESTSATLIYVIYELAKNPKAQEKAREEVKKMEKDNSGRFPSEEAIRNYSYLDMLLHETLRIYPLFSILFRKVVKPYTLDNGSTLTPGTLAIIPVQGIQNDPEFWPEPDSFKPERFEKNSSRVPFTYLGFGEGPRMCVAHRLATLIIKTALGFILSEYKIELTEKTENPLKMNQLSLTLAPTNQIYLRFRPLDSNNN